MARILGFGSDDTTEDKLKAAISDLSKRQDLLRDENTALAAAHNAVAAADDDALAAAIDTRTRIVAYVEQRVQRVAQAQDRVDDLTAQIAAEADAAAHDVAARLQVIRLERFIVAFDKGIPAMVEMHDATADLVQNGVLDLASLAGLVGQIVSVDLPPAIAAGVIWSQDSIRNLRRIDTPLPKAVMPGAEVSSGNTGEPTITVPVALYSAIAPVIYTDVRDGNRKTVNRGGNLYLSAVQAELAIKQHKAAPFDARNKEQQAWRSISGSTLPEPHLLYDLDTGQAPDRSAAGMKTLSKSAKSTSWDPTKILPSRPGVFEAMQGKDLTVKTHVPATAAARSNSNKKR